MIDRDYEQATDENGHEDDDGHAADASHEHVHEDDACESVTSPSLLGVISWSMYYGNMPKPTSDKREESDGAK